MQYITIRCALLHFARQDEHLPSPFHIYTQSLLEASFLMLSLSFQYCCYYCYYHLQT